MGRFLALLFLVAGGWLLANKIGNFLDPGLGTLLDGREVVRDMGPAEARFSVVGSLDAAYMLFGGQMAQRRNSLVDANAAGLEIRHARMIAASYPDFHMCKSPGAPQAQRLTENLSFLAANRRARGRLDEALDLFRERVGRGGERTCIEVSGAPLVLDSVRLRDGGEDFTHELARAFAREQIVLAESVEIVNCRDLL